MCDLRLLRMFCGDGGVEGRMGFLDGGLASGVIGGRDADLTGVAIDASYYNPIFFLLR